MITKKTMLTAFFFLFASIHSARAQETLQELAAKLRQSRASVSSIEGFESTFSVRSQIILILTQLAESSADQLCNEFIDLNIEDLIELSDLIDSEQELIDLLSGCYERIDMRLKAHYQRVENRLLSEHLARRPPSPFTLRAWGPSRAVVLNDQRAGVSLPQEQRLPRKWVALTFDDGPHPTLTPQLLEIFREEQVQVTFFWIGRNVTNHRRIVQDANALGHLIGSHTQTHPNLASRNFQSAVSEIQQGIQSIRSVLGFADPLFRFPYGARTQALRSHLRQQGITDFFWDVDTRDWQIKDPQRLLRFSLEETRKRDGGIVLFHDIQRQTIAMMRTYIQTLKAEGYTPAIYQPSHQ